MQHTIRYMERRGIDITKWDECIRTASNSLVYGFSWWLDAMSKNWGALVLNDYEAVMPLTWKKKYGFYYLHQPWFTASLGLFSKPAISQDLAVFLQAIPAHFRFWDIDVHETNTLNPPGIKGLQVHERKNMLLKLSDGYNMAENEYSRLAKRKLRLAAGHNLLVNDRYPVRDAIHFYKHYYGDRHPAITTNDYQNLITACEKALAENHATCYAAQQDEKTKAVFIVLKDDHFFYSLLGGSTPEGQQLGAFYFLTDAAISDAANAGCNFRFEGSDIEGISFFNSQFGPEEIKYYHLKLNKLPFFAKVFKQ